jgi:hypothetical protein
VGFIDLEIEKLHHRRVKSMLSKRGLMPDLSQEWEIHGPHQSMNYQILVGWAYDDSCNRHLVAVYSRAIYEIDDYSKWWDVGDQNRIALKK